ncbi:uncharacterized protein [Eleutherodactylus coqui]|uniref:uncharacterized protein isoform X8 n=1 Tax=Eleutherodactylus coqui TaxID=57060 RepID=UPI00346317F7
MFRSSTIGFITTEMTQHRMTTILLFVCLSLCLEVLQSQLLKCGDPCIYSDDCESRCCFRDSPKGSGKCVLNSIPYVKCYGPNESNRCFYSHQCHSGCCFPIGTAKESTCVHKNPESRKCLGPDDGDSCAVSEYCKSGCCQLLIGGICRPKAKENEACDPESHNGLYDNCPCESGLICEKDTPERKPFLCGEYFLIVNYSNLSRRICKKPDTANKCN